MCELASYSAFRRGGTVKMTTGGTEEGRKRPTGQLVGWVVGFCGVVGWLGFWPGCLPWFSSFSLFFVEGELEFVLEGLKVLKFFAK